MSTFMNDILYKPTLLQKNAHFLMFCFVHIGMPKLVLIASKRQRHLLAICSAVP